jgi:hypothetical protein
MTPSDRRSTHANSAWRPKALIPKALQVPGRTCQIGMAISTPGRSQLRLPAMFPVGTAIANEWSVLRKRGAAADRKARVLEPISGPLRRPLF